MTKNRTADTDACPGALRLHAAADGPLARVRLPGGLLTGAQLEVLGDLARRRGDGGLELTSRANIQLRALTAADPTELAARLAEAGLLPSPAHETVRNIATPPLADAATRALVRALDEGLCADPALASLPGRFLFAVGEVALDPDVAAVPTPAGPAPADPAPARYAVLFAGVDHGLRVPPAQVAPALLAAAHAFLAERSATPGKPAWRLRELPDGPARVARRTAEALGTPLVPDAPLPRHRPDADLIGVVRQPGGLAAAAALVPLGRLGAAAIRVLGQAERLVVTPGRGVVVPDLAPRAAAAWLDRLAAAGLAVEAASRWTGVTACAGRPGCAKSLSDVRADATAATRFVGGLPVHWVGCGRGCGSPAGPHVRVEATPAGYTVARQPEGKPAGDANPPAANNPAGCGVADNNPAGYDPADNAAGNGRADDGPAGNGLADMVATARRSG